MVGGAGIGVGSEQAYHALRNPPSVDPSFFYQLDVRKDKFDYSSPEIICRVAKSQEMQAPEKSTNSLTGYICFKSKP
jgi:hypothetical protein